MKTIDTEQLKELGKLYLKHSKKKKKLFGGEKLKLNDNDFWFELVSIDWFKELFDLSSDVTIEDFKFQYLEKYGFSFKNYLAVGVISKEIAMEKLTTLKDINDFVARPSTLTSTSMIGSYLENLQKGEGIKFSPIKTDADKEKKLEDEKELEAFESQDSKENFEMKEPEMFEKQDSDEDFEIIIQELKKVQEQTRLLAEGPLLFPGVYDDMDKKKLA